MLPVNFYRILLLYVYSDSLIFGTQYEGCLLLVLSHGARAASGVNFAVGNGEVTHSRLQIFLALLLERERALYKTVSENGTYRKGIYHFIRKVLIKVT